MKKILIALFLLSSLLTVSLGFAAYSYWDSKTMTAEEVRKKWGNQTVDFNKFKGSNYDEKAKMAYAIMTDNSLLGKSYEDIRLIFGENDGYFFTGTIPAYIVQKGKSHSEETWQLVFRMDRQYKVKEIVMHKNCCE